MKNQNRYNCLIKLNSNSKIGASSSRSPDLIAAEIRQYDAQSAAISLNANLDAKRAEADVKRAELESSAIRSREFTDAKRAEAESSAIILNANADAKRAEAEASAIRSRTIALFFFRALLLLGSL